jgi:CheY-like chemotaxis protein
MAILVVDDDSNSRTLLTAILTAEGYEVRPSGGGKLALGSVAVQRN